MVEIPDSEYQKLQSRLKELEAAVAERLPAEQAGKRMEEELKVKIDELKIINDAAVGRELKMMELEKEVNGLLMELGRKPKYK